MLGLPGGKLPARRSLWGTFLDMEPRTNGHGDDHRRAESDREGAVERPRLYSDGPPPQRSTAHSLRAADQLARLEARIREFHRNLESLDVAEADVARPSRLTPEADAERPRSTAEAHAAADSLVTRAAAAARLAASSGAHATNTTNTNTNPTNTNPTNTNPTNTNTREPADPTPTPAVTKSGERPGRPDGRAEGPFSARRRIDALRPETGAHPRTAPAPTSRTPAALDAVAEAQIIAERILRDAEGRAEQLRADAERDASEIRRGVESEMEDLWAALETEIQTIQSEISRRVDHLVGRMEAVGQATEQIRRAATVEAEQIRAEAVADAALVHAAASDDVEELLIVAEREAHGLLAEAHAQADALIAEARAQADTRLADARAQADTRVAQPDPVIRTSAQAESGPPLIERNAAERLAEQIREATAALSRRVSRAGGDVHSVAREICSPATVPNSIREVLAGLGTAVSLIERSLAGLAEVLASDDSEDS
jgi:hypothetical protein